MHRTLLKEMKERSDVKDIEALTDVAGMLLDSIKETEPDFYKHSEKLLYESLYGKKLTAELAEKLIHEMRPHGMKWTREQTNEVMRMHGLSLDSVDFWIVMNMAYNDYHEMFDEDVDKYAEFSRLFIEDIDAPKCKVYKTFI